MSPASGTAKAVGAAMLALFTTSAAHAQTPEARAPVVNGTALAQTLDRADSATGPDVARDGADNQITANDEPPAGSLVGAIPKSPPRAPVLTLQPLDAPAGALVLSADNDRETVNCAGRDVLIHGNGGEVRLLGGCRSVSVQGRNNRVEAQLRPGARVLIGGPSVTLHYTLTADGPPPVVSATASNSTVTQVKHFDGGASLTVPAGTPIVIAQPR